MGKIKEKLMRTFFKYEVEKAEAEAQEPLHKDMELLWKENKEQITQINGLKQELQGSQEFVSLILKDITSAYGAENVYNALAQKYDKDGWRLYDMCKQINNIDDIGSLYPYEKKEGVFEYTNPTVQLGYVERAVFGEVVERKYDEYGEQIIYSEIDKTTAEYKEYREELYLKTTEYIITSGKGPSTDLLKFLEENSKSLKKSKLERQKPYEEIDKFYVDTECERVDWVYFNPDSSAGGQFVYNSCSFDMVKEALQKEDVLDYLSSVCKQELVDIDTPAFESAAQEFMKETETFNSLRDDVVEELKRVVNKEQQANMSDEELLEHITSEELATFLRKMEHKPSEEVVEEAFEIVMKKDIKLTIDNLTDERDIKVLANMKYPIDAVYQEWLSKDYSYMDLLREACEEVVKRELEFNKDLSKEFIEIEDVEL